MDRREALGSIGAVAGLAAGGDLAAAAGVTGAHIDPGAVGRADAEPGPGEFRRKADFAIPAGWTYLNSAYTHPMPKGAAASVGRYLDGRTQPDADLPPEPVVDLKAEFAALINARPAEISYITSTSAGENLVVEALGIGRLDGNVVTDALHFDGALVHLYELEGQTRTSSPSSPPASTTRSTAAPTTTGSSSTSSPRSARTSRPDATTAAT